MIPDIPNRLAFVGASLVVLATPGPGVLFVVAHSLNEGRRAGLISALGLSTGALVHVLAAAAGLSAILLASATAFTVVKYLGAAYLVYLGLKTLLSRASARPGPRATSMPDRRRFIDGVVVSVLNPKIAIFFLAFLPQFVDPSTGDAALQILALGGLYAGLALATDSAYALLATRLRPWLDARFLPSGWTKKLSAAVYFLLGALTLLADRRVTP